MREQKGKGGRDILSLAHERSPIEYGLGHETSMWANMRIIVLLNSLKVGVTSSHRTRKVDICANGGGAYAPYAPPLPTGLVSVVFGAAIPKSLCIFGKCFS